MATGSQPNQTQPYSEAVASGGGAGTIHEAILETLASAVISLEPGGRVITFNAAAGAITGLAPEAVIGLTFAEIFLAMEGAENFAQAVLDAVYHGPLVRQRVVTAEFPAGKRTLSMSVSHIKETSSDNPGIAVVFDDITELRELRAKEIELSREVEAQNRELKAAYLRLETRHQDLEEGQKQLRPARIGAITGGILLLTALTLYGMSDRSDTSPEPIGTLAFDPDDATVYTVEPRSLSKSINITGRLAPRREVDITSPMNGTIAAVHAPFGARVESGQPLIELDVSEVRIEHRVAKAAHIKALEQFNESSNWSESVEVSRAKRSLTKAQIELENSRSKLEETVFLLERGVIPTSEHEAAKRSFQGRQLDMEAAEQDVATILAKGEAGGRVGRLELENAQARLEELEETLRLSVMRAPVTGVVMRAPATGQSGGGANKRDRLGSGDAVTQGARLLMIGDLDGLSIVGRVDEIDVTRVQPGSPVSVRGEAFPGTVLQGKVERVSSQAIQESGFRTQPSYEIVAMVERLTEQERLALRIGMSAVMEVVVLEKPDALLVPIEAVVLADGQPMIRVASGEDFHPVTVTVGETTIDSIEITDGIAPGDRILVPAQ